MFLSGRTRFALLTLLILTGCGPAKPPAIPDDLKAYVTQPPIAPFSLRPSPPAYVANLATYQNPPTAKQQEELINKLIAFGAIRQLVVRNGGEKIESLVKFNKLEGLHLSFSTDAISKSIDLRPLAQMKDLKELSVGYEGGVDLSDAVIAVPPGLINLSLHKLPIRSIPGIENCKDLRELDISFNSLKEVDALKNVPPLKVLRISEPTLTLISEKNFVLKAELTEIVETTSLSKTKVDAIEVSIYGPQLTKLDGIENWQGVASLKLNYLTNLEDISALAKSKVTREIVFTQCWLRGKPIANEDLKEIQQATPNCQFLIK